MASKRLSIILTESCVTINDAALPDEITEELVVRLFGPPDRVEEGRPPAPPGHRNNQILFYDSYGIYWIRQHKSGLMIELGIVFHPDPENPLQRRPHSSFSGDVRILEYRLDSRSTVQGLLKTLGNAIRKRFGGIIIAHVAGHDLTVTTRVLQGREDEIANIEIGFGEPLFATTEEL
jgi:hypothetical protein